MEQRVMQLAESSVVQEDVQKRIVTAGVRGLDVEKAKELGLFKRISNLLCAVHATVLAAYRIYGGVDYLMTEFRAKKNEIAREMGLFEKAYKRFVNFWTNYYAYGGAAKEVNDNTEILFQNIMDWAQLPMEWNLGEKQRLDDKDLNISIRILLDDDSYYTFRKTTTECEPVGEVKESWCVTKYDTRYHKQSTVDINMDKASAMMVAKRLSAEDTDNIYTASVIQEITEKRKDVIPFKAFVNNKNVGSITKEFK